MTTVSGEAFKTRGLTGFTHCSSRRARTLTTPHKRSQHFREVRSDTVKRRSRPSRAIAEASHKLPKTYDLVLSSGFLSFANHAGFLQAVDDCDLRVGGLMGTSAGALTGALYAAGYSPQECVEVLCELPPFRMLRLPTGPWGVFNLEAVTERMAELLPATFEELPTEFACGVVAASSPAQAVGREEYMVIDSGPLPEAVVASAAVPYLFQPVPVRARRDTQPLLCVDGGLWDRVGLRGWRERRRCQAKEGSNGYGPEPNPVIAHVIERSSQFSGDDDTDAMAKQEDHVLFIKTPKAGLSLLSVGDYQHTKQCVTERITHELTEGLSLPLSTASSGGDCGELLL